MKETPVSAVTLHLLVRALSTERYALAVERDKRGECLIEQTPERFLDGIPETYHGVCLTHSVVADMAHHLNVNPNASTD